MTTAIVWFRHDLRLTDNPALYYAATQNQTIVPLYILDEALPSYHGKAQQWWLHHSLLALQEQLRKLELNLILKRGDSHKILSDLCKEKTITAIYWNRSYEPTLIKNDIRIKKELGSRGIKIQSYNGSLLYDPEEITTKQGSYFKLFTPFWNRCQIQPIEATSLAVPPLKQKILLNSEELHNWQLLPTHPNWAEGFNKRWKPGELHAKNHLNYFVSTFLENYPTARDFPAQDATSKLSPYLHFGEITPKQIWNTIKLIGIQQPSLLKACNHFLRQLGWREFSYHLLYHFPTLAKENFQKKFDYFPWSSNNKFLSCWQKGQTGYPLVDAGMRELWHSGYIHNRVRMITASFLTKHLLIDWRQGAEWFLDTLVDADLANNAMGWQWVAGSGVDAAPYYRIFNPIIQSQKFDPKGEYIRRWVPELKKLSDDYIHYPWKSPEKILKAAEIILGKNYPHPIIEHDFARKRALDNYKIISKN